MKPLVVIRRSKSSRTLLPDGTPAPIPPATIGVLVIEYRAGGRRVAQSTGIRVRYDKWNAEAREIRGNLEALYNRNLTRLYNEANAACISMAEAKKPSVSARAKALAAGEMRLDELLLFCTPRPINRITPQYRMAAAGAANCFAFTFHHSHPCSSQAI